MKCILSNIYLHCRKSLDQFHSSIYNAASTGVFMREFTRCSKAGDRHSMVEMLLQLDQISETDVNACFTPKDNEKAERLYNDVNSGNEHPEKISHQYKIDLLTEALFAAEFDSLLMLKIITARAKYEFSVESYQRCCKDCDYGLQLLNNSENSELQNELAIKMRTMCNLLKAQSLKHLRKSNKQSSHEKKVPKMEGKLNKKLKSCSDAVALVHDDARGRHLIAVRNIKAGSVLIVDEPFSFSTDEAALLTNCLHCHSSLQGNESIRVPCSNCQTVSICISALLVRFCFRMETLRLFK